MLGVEDLADTAGLSVGDYLGTWLGHVKGRVRGTTYDGYEALVRRHAVPGLGSIPLRSLHPLQVKGLYAQMLAPRYRGQARSPSAKTESGKRAGAFITLAEHWDGAHWSIVPTPKRHVAIVRFGTSPKPPVEP